MSLLDDVFKLLGTATKLEENPDSRIEAATKYYEAVYLMRQYIQRLPSTAEHQQKRELLESKAFHYEQLAQKCLASCNSTVGGLSSPCSDATRTIASDPRSPIAKTCFFNEDSSVIPMRPKPAVPAPAAPAVGPPVDAQIRRFSLSNQVDQITSQANAKLTSAMDVDEMGTKHRPSAINLYMEAAELYLKGVRVSEEQNSGVASNVTSVLKRRLEQTLGKNILHFGRMLNFECYRNLEVLGV